MYCLLDAISHWVTRCRCGRQVVAVWVAISTLSSVSAADNQGSGDTATSPNYGQLIRLPQLSATEIAELVRTLRIQLETEFGYREETTTGDVPRGIAHAIRLTRSTPQPRTLFLGTLQPHTQAPRLWLRGFESSPNETKRPNPDLAGVQQLVEQTLPEIKAEKDNLKKADLKYHIVQLNHIDITGALEALKGFGFTTFATVGDIPEPIDYTTLPIIAPMPQPSAEQTALLGQSDPKKLRGSFDLSVTPSSATVLPDSTNLAPSSRLIILYPPAQPDQYSQVVHALEDTIDRPARQIFVEGLVLEISEEGINELGIDWEFDEGNFSQNAGNLDARRPGSNSTLNFTFDDLRDLDKNWSARLRALVESGKAEILSRPSVLTLNNRQATIRVGTDIPIATSQEGLGGNSNKISFDFKYLATGISLNIRPRITASGDEVGILIDTIVSSVVPGGELELRSSEGSVLASAPTVATRRVQTYARIENNTPFIIGGLVSKETIQRQRKIPLLAEIPYLGQLFRAKSTRATKREVIIVLTPYVLVNDATTRALGRFLPKDEDRFDEFGNVLFRDFYRIRNEDVFDLDFLTADTTLQTRLENVRSAIAQNQDLTAEAPFNRFTNNHFPGEEILVQRMIYEVIKRLSEEASSGADWLNQRVEIGRMILFEKPNISGYEVAFLDEILTRLGDGNSGEGFFDANPGKALVLRFSNNADESTSGNLRLDPIPEISVVECADDAAWTRLLAEGNQPDPLGRSQASIVLRSPEDILRLRRAVLLDQVIQLNGGKSRTRLNNFSLGKVLLMPEPEPNKVHLLDETIAQYFYHTEQYYAAFLQQLEGALENAESLLK